MLTPAVKKHIAETTRMEVAADVLRDVHRILQSAVTRLEPGLAKIELAEARDKAFAALTVLTEDGCDKCGMPYKHEGDQCCVGTVLSSI